MDDRSAANDALFPVSKVGRDCRPQENRASLECLIMQLMQVLPNVASNTTIHSTCQPFPEPNSLPLRCSAFSVVTSDQYAQQDIGKMCDDSAGRYKHSHPNPSVQVSFIYPSNHPYVCPCSNADCMLLFKSKEEALAGCLKHAPDMLGQSVQFMEPFWTASYPQQIEFKPLGPVMQIEPAHTTGQDTTGLTVRCICCLCYPCRKLLSN